MSSAFGWVNLRQGIGEVSVAATARQLTAWRRSYRRGVAVALDGGGFAQRRRRVTRTQWSDGMGGWRLYSVGAACGTRRRWGSDAWAPAREGDRQVGPRRQKNPN
jgi:hypothetical protein